MATIKNWALGGLADAGVRGVVDALVSLARRPKTFGLARKVRRAMREVGEALQDREAERQVLLDRFAKKHEDGSRVTERPKGSDADVVKFEDEAGFLEAWQGLLNADVEILVTFTPEDFEAQPAGFMLEDELELLGPLFDDAPKREEPVRATRPARRAKDRRNRTTS